MVYDSGMFEGNLPLAHLAHDFGADSHGESGDAEDLREVSWSDLRSRLEAARDLRASLRAVADEQCVDHWASFDAHSARHIAALTECKHAVNPEDLANGKGGGSIDVSSANAGPDADIVSDPRN